MKFEFKVDTSKFDRMLSDIPAAIERAKQQALEDIGAAVASMTTRAFREEALRPSPWAPRKPTYIVKVNKKTGMKTNKLDDHPLLIKSGALRQSIGWKLQGSDTVVIGTDRKYARYHQTGTKNMPARPVFPVKDGNLTPRVERKVKGIVDKAFSGALPKGSIPRPIWPGGS